MKRLILLFALLLALPMGCSDAAGNLIQASEGGSVSSGTHSVEIPAGSLTEDTEVSIATADITTVGALENARDNILLLEPEGTRLETAATVEIDASFIDADATQQVRIFQFGDGEWIPQESSETSGGGRSVSVTYFAPLAVVVEDAASTGSIRGTLIWNGSGDPVTEQELILNGEGVTDLSTTTDAEGVFSFAELEPGTYTLTGGALIECPITETITVAAGEQSTPAFSLCGSSS